MIKKHREKDLNMVLKALKKGDQRVFETIYCDYYERLCVYLLSYTSDKEKIEDIVQDTFMTLWSKRNTIHITSSIKSYLYRTVHNKLMDTFRSSKKHDEMLSSYLHTALVRAINLDQGEQNRRLKKLDECIEQLPTRCKTVFIAKKITGKKYTQIASDLKISEKTIEGHISRAYKLIRSCMSVNKEAVVR
ncbi:RNA polymerase sigma factor [Allomuricauda sp. SCSIO 65647]|uniref:RNA polymerase sigma factor n=1 Tax=Allomuricauda sp. SCSIO 65647 TaxID=2908843 RepID=UPI001F33E1FD|nr:RNA polymerase sigma-70 factor [Muricauda sp. SCSIO 65647]UJH67044.1 RNA polymerase sigma-70 factor [Muricauda sp. SCSIO 65647]